MKNRGERLRDDRTGTHGKRFGKANWPPVLKTFPVLSHLWFLWFLCWVVCDLRLLVEAAAKTLTNSSRVSNVANVQSRSSAESRLPRASSIHGQFRNTLMGQTVESDYFRFRPVLAY